MQDPINWFYELFYSVEIWGFLGPAAVVMIGWAIAKKDKQLGMFWFILELIMIGTFYAPRLPVEGAYLYHMLILLIGGFLTCVSEWMR